ncbi:MAG: hypothetical protein ACT4PO_14400, partial [Actinomycetota bacterium]
GRRASRACVTCGRLPWACACALSFREKVKTLRFDTEWMPARSVARHEAASYYDPSPVAEMFPDAAERALDATDGLGPAQRGPGGELYHRDRRSKEMVRVSDAELDQVYLGGRTETWGDDQ